MLTNSNSSFSMPSTFLLIGIPGLEGGTLWISISFGIIYILGILCNCTILYVIITEKSLHGPMYFFLSMLAMNEVALSSTTMPKLLGVLWFGAHQILAVCCLTQMFFVHLLSGFESGILTAMAYDRFIAICYPLRYVSILTNVILGKIATVIVVRAIVIILPLPIMTGQLQYCTKNVVYHSYCDHMAVVKVACGDIQFNNVYGLVVSLSIIGFDLMFVILSYVMILRAVNKLPTREARHKALGTCGSHISVIFIAAVPIVFNFVAYRVVENTVSLSLQVFCANIYILIPSLLNPIIYGLKTKQIREQLLRTPRPKTVTFKTLQ
ncbi:olfactory receptor 52K1-like [Pelobates cultripes]|uniref:Olfactory receptor n=1 Tax=Pelobates cultripes TaxID=61616 RepID=A0AAD1VN48_PELCU|nr:olfactory receptor 52K1-like [Pelobates cultripes]